MNSSPVISSKMAISRHSRNQRFYSSSGSRDKPAGMRLRALFLLIALALVSSVATVAQAEATNSREQDQVSISVFITDAHDNPLTTISEGDVSIEDDHMPPVRVIGITHNNSPLRLGVLIDKSNSQRLSELYKPAVEGLNEFLRGVLQRDVDKVFVETFGTAPDQPTPWLRVDEFESTKFHLQPGGGTALFDAIERACKERFADDSSSARRVLVVLTDGEDNMSHVSHQAAIEAAQRARVAIIAISTGNGYEPRGASMLKNLAENTGGYTFLDLGQKGMQQVFSQIASQLDSMFQVVYVPAAPASGRQAHQLQIKPAAGKKLRVQAPKRYYTTTP